MSRRLPLEPEGRRQRTDPSFQPGSTRGRIGNASPVGDGGGRGRVRPTSPGNTGPGGGAQFYDEEWTLTAAGAQPKALKYLPLPYSEHVRIGTVLQRRGVDFTLTGETLNLLTAMGAEAGEVLSIEYAYAGAVSSTPGDPPGAVPVAYGSGGWKYLQIAANDTVNRSAISFDDSAWSVGTAGFGGGSGSTPFFVPVTAWTGGTAIWLRRTIPAGRAGYTVRARVDDTVELFWNGVLIGSGGGSNISEAAASIGPFTVPADAVTINSQVLAARSQDAAGLSYIDVTVTSP